MKIKWGLWRCDSYIWNSTTPTCSSPSEHPRSSSLPPPPIPLQSACIFYDFLLYYRTNCNFDDVDVDPFCGWQQDFRSFNIPCFYFFSNQPDQPKSWTMDRHYIPLHTTQGQRWVGIVNWADTNPWNWAFRGSWGEHLYLKVLNKPTLNIITYFNIPTPHWGLKKLWLVTRHSSFNVLRIR